MIAICRRFPSPEVVIPFKTVGELMSCVENQQLSPHALLSEVCHAWRLHGHFSCGFDVRHGP